MSLQCSTPSARARADGNHTNLTTISLQGAHRNRYCHMVHVHDETVARVSLPVAMPVSADLEPFVTAGLKLLRSSGRLDFPEHAASGRDNSTSTCPSQSSWDVEVLARRQHTRRQAHGEWEMLGLDAVAMLPSLRGLLGPYIVALLLMLMGLVIGCAQGALALVAQCKASACCGTKEDSQVQAHEHEPDTTSEDKWPRATLEEVGAIKASSAHARTQTTNTKRQTPNTHLPRSTAGYA